MPAARQSSANARRGPPWRVSPHNTANMALDSQEALLYGGAAALRLVLFTVFPALPSLLAGRVEVSTPVTSFKRCRSHPLPVERYDAWQPADLYSSAGRPLPIHPQCLSLRRRPLPPGTPPAAAFLAATGPLVLPNRYRHRLHRGGSPQRVCLGSGCSEWEGCCLQAVLVFEEGPAMEPHSHCGRVRFNHATPRPNVY